MLNVGLTGNIAAGKSTVADLFARWGATVVDADVLVREVQAPGSPVLKTIQDRFGAELILSDGTLDRAALRRVVAGDSQALEALNEIVHPAVQQRRAERMAQAETDGDLIVINDIPLLFEVLEASRFDLVILVDAPEEIRKNRLMANRSIAADEADAMIQAQMRSAEKRARSRFVIDNDGPLEQVEEQAWGIWCVIRREAAAAQLQAGARLLALLAHPDDESFGTGGTLARYADAGAEVHLWCATHGEAGTLSGEVVPPEKLSAVRKQELQKAADILGVRQLHQHDFPDGGLDPRDPEGRAAVTHALQRFRPNVIVTFGPDGITGDPDHAAVHAWVKSSWEQLGSPGQLYYLTYPAALAASLPRPLTGRPDSEIAASLDVRPWRDLKMSAIEAHASQAFPFALDEPPANQLLDREWFSTPAPTQGRVDDLFHGIDTA